MIEGQLEGEGRSSARRATRPVRARGRRVRFTVEDSEFLVLGGQPLNELLVNYGPFVMNPKTKSTPASATTAQA